MHDHDDDQTLIQESAPPCPACGSTEVVRILYGYPTDEALADAREDRIVLGGCIIDGDDPDWNCNACGHQFALA